MGCKIRSLRRTKRLALGLQWKLDGRSVRSQEALGVRDTEKNRAVVKRDLADPINAEIRTRKFDRVRYLHWFPHGAKGQQFRRELGQWIEAPVPTDEIVTVRSYYEKWIERQKPPHVRPGQARDYRNQITRYILPIMGDYRLDEIRPAHLFELRDVLSQRKKLSGKGFLAPRRSAT